MGGVLMLSFSPSHNSPVVEQGKIDLGQSFADHDGYSWVLYCVLSGDRRVICSYEYWPASDIGTSHQLAQYGRQPDYIFTPKGVIF